MTDQAFHYASSAVDIDGHDLPGLKACFVVDRVADGTTVLDVGCGGGKMLRTIAAHRSAVTLLGCDVTPPAELDGVFAFSALDPPDGPLPYADGSIDAVLVFDVLEHVREPEAMLAEARRALRDDGVLLAFVPVEGERLSWYRLFRRLLGDDLYARTKGHVQAFTHRDVEELVGVHFVIEERVFAYHPLGQLMDAGLCAALSLGPVQRSFWAYSPFHGEETPPRGFLGRSVAAVLRLANALAWAESSILRRVRTGSAGVLLAARPRPEQGCRGVASLGSADRE